MRIERLALESFGHFRGQSLEFGPGVTLLCGPNEAGKSTLLGFIRSMLFGFEGRNNPLRYEPEGGALAGELWLATEFGRLKVRRTSGRKVVGDVTIRDQNGQTLAETKLADALSGVERELFFQVFAFSLDELSEFEKLSKETSIHEALLAAGMRGARRLPLATAALAKSTDELFTPRSRNKPLNQRFEELEQVQEQLRMLGDRPAELIELEARRRGLRTQLEALVVREREDSARLAVFERLVASAADVAAFGLLERDLAGTERLAAFPEELVARFEQLGERRQRAKTELGNLEREREQLVRSRPSGVGLVAVPGRGDPNRARARRRAVRRSTRGCRRGSPGAIAGRSSSRPGCAGWGLGSRRRGSRRWSSEGRSGRSSRTCAIGSSRRGGWCGRGAMRSRRSRPGWGGRGQRSPSSRSSGQGSPRSPPRRFAGSSRRRRGFPLCGSGSSRPSREADEARRRAEALESEPSVAVAHAFPLGFAVAVLVVIAAVVAGLIVTVPAALWPAVALGVAGLAAVAFAHVRATRAHRAQQAVASTQRQAREAEVARLRGVERDAARAGTGSARGARAGDPGARALRRCERLGARGLERRGERAACGSGAPGTARRDAPFGGGARVRGRGGAVAGERAASGCRGRTRRAGGRAALLARGPLVPGDALGGTGARAVDPGAGAAARDGRASGGRGRPGPGAGGGEGGLHGALRSAVRGGRAGRRGLRGAAEGAGAALGDGPARGGAPAVRRPARGAGRSACGGEGRAGGARGPAGRGARSGGGRLRGGAGRAGRARTRGPGEARPGARARAADHGGDGWDGRAGPRADRGRGRERDARAEARGARERARRCPGAAAARSLRRRGDPRT